ncbi:MoaD/ThiS family protein [Algoriphagus sp. CAU 1675]|uniref:MoaD/ThiS family protein n=1 Tax=Algoriphagus sp. CAU 1675 TaxID=3032597 RepID=UPI0023DBCD1C|nr:MoaD/ThiS family protein [Algoriphagus sp. CAU 1675]MDF2158316.1 MoaD/ThiS family protein [Algoriphagus sp. CAU 1675]
MYNKINIKAFGMIAEKLGNTALEWDACEDTDGLRKELEARFPDLKEMKYSIAINKTLIVGNVRLPEQAEVALLPPFSGG